MQTTLTDDSAPETVYSPPKNIESIQALLRNYVEDVQLVVDGELEFVVSSRDSKA